jgi:hypothetical protein
MVGRGQVPKKRQACDIICLYAAGQIHSPGLPGKVMTVNYLMYSVKNAGKNAIKFSTYPGRPAAKAKFPEAEAHETHP